MLACSSSLLRPSSPIAVISRHELRGRDDTPRVLPSPRGNRSMTIPFLLRQPLQPLPHDSTRRLESRSVLEAEYRNEQSLASLYPRGGPICSARPISQLQA